ncbi:hypothetical protein G7085_15535 [Tessaracoccus sp. HDW20]|uniref:aldose epimerase family protein n=1 Tax=Tessaracoccus coleopterorum TaxID=2714950 RepID=UPI0018D35D06|nr:hypothetical protein [Tessaracoccus coleopterorum]NHB85540.1 hypothetical protein [Tessaracoccus coleopterorum]
MLEGCTMLSGAWGDVSAHEIGATVTSWRPAGREVLFTASDAVIDTADMWHGGIPCVLPGSGRPRGWAVPFVHGVVPRVRWRLLDASGDDAGARLRYATDATATAHLPGADRFPSDLRYELEVAADATRLRLDLTVTSPSVAATVEMALHPYLLTDTRSGRVDGLGGVPFTDFTDGSRGAADPPVVLGGYLDRVYDAACPATVDSAEGRLSLSSEGAESLIVWNPGPANKQVPGDEWERFVCVEYGCVKGHPVELPAGGDRRLSMTISVG